MVVLTVVAVWLLLGGLGGTAMGRLSEVQQNDAAAFLPRDAESTRAAQAAREFQPDATLPALVVVEADDGERLTPVQLALVQDFTGSLPALGLGEGTRLGDVLASEPVAVPSGDGRAALVVLPLDAEAADRPIGEDAAVERAVAGVRAASDVLEAAGLRAWVTGPAGAVADLVAAFAGLDGLLLLVALGVVLVILVLVYRSPILPLTVLATALFALAAAAFVVHGLAAADVLVLNGQSQGILFILVVGAATDYSLLLVARYREELRRTASVHGAMARALRASIEPIAASAGTVVAGLLCLLLSDLASNRSLGPVAAIGIVAAFLAATTLLPALLLLGGRRSRAVFWPRVPRPVADGDADGVARPAAGEPVGGLWQRVAALVGRHPRRVWAVTAVVLVAAAAWLPTFRASGTSESDIFLTEVESVVGERVLAEHFDAGGVQPVTVVAPTQDVSEVLAAARTVDGVVSATPVSATAGPPGATAGPPLEVSGRVLVEVVTEVSAQSQRAVELAGQVRSAVHEVSPGALVGGAAAERLDTQATSVRDLTVIVPVVLAVILVVLIGLLRAVVAPVLIVGANLLSFAATLGIGALVFNEGLDLPGADPSVPLYAFVFLVALGIDYSIFLMTRVREEALVHGTRAGVRRGVAVTGGVITSAGVVLAATFGALAVLPLLFLLQIAFLVAVGVLIDTFLVRTLLVPGLVHDLGRASWWPWRTIED